jgi:porphobilinogen synthase
MQENNLPLRMSRLRRMRASRALVRETRLHVEQLVMPLFISETLTEKKAISSMPGLYQLTLKDLPEEIDLITRLKIPAVILFGIPAKKDAYGGAAFQDEGIIQQAIRIIRSINSELLIISDLCFCEYTDHGHCGVLEKEYIDREQTCLLLGQQAVAHAKAGAHWVAPSGMTDGMVAAIRHALDAAKYVDVPILSYSAKYCSCLYNPFREAAEGPPQFGDRKSYQMDPGNALEALREVSLDLAEGADMVMVKPALHYLDVIYRIKQNFPEVPLCAYHVSGEYAMIKAASMQGMINEQQAMVESLIAIKRAGADFIITYFAKDMAMLLQN